MKSVKTAVYWMFTTLEAMFLTCIVLVAVINVTMLVQQNFMEKRVPTIFGYSYINVLSSSMEPAVSAGDLVICKEKDEYEIGDAILFEEQDYLILHRIVDINEKGEFITRGDANPSNDEYPVTPALIHGEMVGVLTGWGSNMAYMTSRMGAFWTLLSALFIYLALDMGRALLKEAPESISDEEEVFDEEDFGGIEGEAILLEDASQKQDESSNETKGKE